MPFKPGNKANPHGRPRKKPDARSEMLEELCKKHRGDIEKVVEVAIKKALKGEDKAIKLVMDMFVPKPGTFAPVEKITTHNKMSVNIKSLIDNVPFEHRSALWQALTKPQPKTAEVVDVRED